MYVHRILFSSNKKNVISIINNNNNRNVRYISEFLSRISSIDRSNDIVASFPNTTNFNNNNNNNNMTYGELNKITSNIGNYFKSDFKDIKIIGSYHHGEAGYIISMIAAFKANLTFVPLSTSHPEQELKYFVEDSNMGLLLHSLGIYFLFSSCFFFFII